MSGTSIALDDERLGCLMECLVIHYEHKPESGTFVIVSDSWEKSGDGRRAFIRILFSEVEAFERELGIHHDARKFVEVYRPRGAAPPIVFQDVEASPEGAARTRVKLWFGPAFGGVSFTCRDYSAWTRVARVRQQGSTWEYRDATTGDVMDFYAPFGAGH